MRYARSPRRRPLRWGGVRARGSCARLSARPGKHPPPKPEPRWQKLGRAPHPVHKTLWACDRSRCAVRRKGRVLVGGCRCEIASSSMEQFVFDPRARGARASKHRPMARRSAPERHATETLRNESGATTWRNAASAGDVHRTGNEGRDDRRFGTQELGAGLTHLSNRCSIVFAQR